MSRPGDVGDRKASRSATSRVLNALIRRSKPAREQPVVVENWGESTQQRFARLLDVQFWFLGRDIEHPDGNLLCQVGFTREPGPDPARPSRYSRTEAVGEVVIWPCGMLLRTDQGDCLMLRGCAPVLVTNQRLRELHDLDEIRAESGQGARCPEPLLVQASRWFADYEQVIDALAGIGHRVPRAATPPALAPARPACLAARWSELAEDLEQEVSGDLTSGLRQ